MLINNHKGTMNKILMSQGIKFIVSIIFIAIIFSPQAGAGYITRAYFSDQQINPGTLVSLEKKDKNKIVLATNQNQNQLIGVAVKQSDSAVGLNPDKGNVTVTTVGVVSVYVSDISGSIKTGDSIAPSPLAGVGMKAVAASNIIGTAKTNFGSNHNSQKIDLKLKDGTKKQVSVTKISILVKVGAYNPADSANPLQQFAMSITGKEVSIFRLIMSTIFLIIIFSIIMVTIFTAVRSSITALGRNPLARKKVYLGLAQVFLVTDIMAIVSAVIAYGILVW